MKIQQVQEDFLIAYNQFQALYAHFKKVDQELQAAGENHAITRQFFNVIQDHSKRAGYPYEQFSTDHQNAVVAEALREAFAFCGFQADYFSREGIIHLKAIQHDTEKLGDKILHLVSPFVYEGCFLIFQATDELYVFKYEFTNKTCQYKTAEIQWK